MIDTKLIFIEGIPGSGKSTITDFISNELSRIGENNIPYFEWTENHPIVVDDEVWFTHDKLKSLNTYKQLNYQKWSEYVGETADNSNIGIFDCSFIQNPVNAFLLLLNEDSTVIHEFYKDLFKIIGSLNPILIYLKQDNVETTFNRVFNSRPEKWGKFIVDYICNSEYGNENGLSGVEGVIKYLKNRQSIEDEVFEYYPYKKLLINNSDFNLSKVKDTVCNFLTS
ncbi:MAG: hypothetical protein K0R21_2137 [Anaerocolumna sp.]|jgi:adenylate kinase|nr:hypothetical protein [Anaerocolumna sp.]